MDVVIGASVSIGILQFLFLSIANCPDPWTTGQEANEVALMFRVCLGVDVLEVIF